MSGSTLRILIVGGGIAGLALARALRLAGFRPEIVDEQAVAPMPGADPANPGPGLLLLANALRALRELDLDIPLRPLGELINRQRFLDAAGQALCSVDLDRLWGPVGQCRALLRAELHQVLYTGVGGEVRHSTTVRALTLAADQVTVTFGDGRQAEYDLVVGADGRRSTVRTLAALGGAPRSTGQLSYHCVISGGPRLTEWISLLGERASFAAMPIGAGRTYCHADVSALAVGPTTPATTHAGGGPAGSPGVAGAPAATAVSDDTGPAARLRDRFAGYGGPLPDLLTALEQVWVTPADEVTLGRWSRGRVVLIGDAAHATAPSLAQGAALALEDAVVLAAELRQAPTVTEALIRYESRRRPRTRWVLDRTRDRDRTRDVPAAVRDPLLRARGGRIFQEHYRLLLDPI